MLYAHYPCMKTKKLKGRLHYLSQILDLTVHFHCIGELVFYDLLLKKMCVYSSAEIVRTQIDSDI